MIHAITTPMISDDPPTADAGPAIPESARSPQTRGQLWLLGLLLAAGVLAAGTRGLNSPWIQGDEYIFIANNPDVTGMEPSGGPTGNRFIDVLFRS